MITIAVLSFSNACSIKFHFWHSHIPCFKVRNKRLSLSPNHSYVITGIPVQDPLHNSWMWTAFAMWDAWDRERWVECWRLMKRSEKLGQSWQQICCCKMGGAHLLKKRNHFTRQKESTDNVVKILTAPAWSDRWSNIVAYHNHKIFSH